MGQFQGRHIVLGVTGGIAAYKAIDLCRRLVEEGAYVSPVLTEGALRFVGSATFSALASEPVQKSLWEEIYPVPHTRLGQRADLIIVCPATARLLADYRLGRSGDLLTATLLATKAPVIICPAMHTEMWEQPSVQENVKVLAERGVKFVGPEDGPLAGGDSGPGRLADPEIIFQAVECEILGKAQELEGCTVLVTAGGTREPICPVRYIGNRSSGKQGHALAVEAAKRGAKVLCVTTEPERAPELPGVEVLPVETAAELAETVLRVSSSADFVFMAAAVADFRPVGVAQQKLKRSEGLPEIHLEPTSDILAELGNNRTQGQVIVGFAAETANLKTNAASKLASKGVDLIVANDVAAADIGFGHDTNAVLILDREGVEIEVAKTDKHRVARFVIDAAIDVAKRCSHGNGLSS